MNTKSGKAKSRRLQNFVAGVFLYLGRQDDRRLQVNDVSPRQMGGAGVDTVMSPLARLMFPYDVECKQVEKLNINAVYAKHAQTYRGSSSVPIVVHSKNRAPVLVTLSFLDFICMVHGKHSSAVEGLSHIAICDTFKRIEELRDSWSAIEAAFLELQAVDSPQQEVV